MICILNSNDFYINITYVTIKKFKIKRLLTKDPSETSSLECIIITSYTVPF